MITTILNEYYKIKKAVKKFRINFFTTKLNITPEKLRQDYFHTSVIRNKRTKGNSGTGAWNTAALDAFETYRKGKKTYLAILDDDDEWYSNYLYSCWLTITNYNNLHNNKYAVGVISSFIRKEIDKTKTIIIQQDDLKIENFLIGNPGWQGSNTFIELNLFWEAGGFDENMQSANDRDLAIRIIEVCIYSDSKRLLHISFPLMVHYVHTEERVTTNKLAKKNGLDIFYQKHLFRMTQEQIAKSLNRAKEFFDYDFSPKQNLFKN